MEKNRELHNQLADLIKDINSSKKSIIEAARILIKSGRNPSTIEGWEEFAKRNNIMLEDLK